MAAAQDGMLALRDEDPQARAVIFHDWQKCTRQRLVAHLLAFEYGKIPILQRLHKHSVWTSVERGAYISPCLMMTSLFLSCANHYVSWTVGALVGHQQLLAQAHDPGAGRYRGCRVCSARTTGDTGGRPYCAVAEWAARTPLPPLFRCLPAMPLVQMIRLEPIGAVFQFIFRCIDAAW